MFWSKLPDTVLVNMQLQTNDVLYLEKKGLLNFIFISANLSIAAHWYELELVIMFLVFCEDLCIEPVLWWSHFQPAGLCPERNGMAFITLLCSLIEQCRLYNKHLYSLKMNKCIQWVIKWVTFHISFSIQVPRNSYFRLARISVVP